MTERQELYCHACMQYVQFDIETELDGQHTIVCPSCGHEHYRYVNAGRISDQRWRSSGPVPGNGYATMPTYYATGTTVSSASYVSNIYFATATTGTTGSLYLAQSWGNTSGS